MAPGDCLPTAVAAKPGLSSGPGVSVRASAQEVVGRQGRQPPEGGGQRCAAPLSPRLLRLPAGQGTALQQAMASACARLGGALNDVGRVMAWLQATLAPVTPEDVHDALTAAPRAETPLVLPFFGLWWLAKHPVAVSAEEKKDAATEPVAS